MNNRQRREMKRAERLAREAVVAGSTSNDQPEVHTARILNMADKKKTGFDKKVAKVVSKAIGTAKTEKKERATNLPALPNLPKAASSRKPKPEVDCLCGCGGKTKGKFMPGHDSYLRSLVLRVERKVMTLDEVEKMVSKGHRLAVERELASKKKAARQATAQATAPKKEVTKKAAGKTAKVEAASPAVPTDAEVAAASEAVNE